MKLFLLVFTACFCLNVFGQTTSAKLPPPGKTAAQAQQNTSEADISFFSLSYLKTKFKINYFSETLGPTIKKCYDNEYMDDG